MRDVHCSPHCYCIWDTGIKCNICAAQWGICYAKHHICSVTRLIFIDINVGVSLWVHSWSLSHPETFLMWADSVKLCTTELPSQTFMSQNTSRVPVWAHTVTSVNGNVRKSLMMLQKGCHFRKDCSSEQEYMYLGVHINVHTSILFIWIYIHISETLSDDLNVNPLFFFSTFPLSLLRLSFSDPTFDFCLFVAVASLKKKIRWCHLGLDLLPASKKNLLRKLRPEEFRAAWFCLFSLFIHSDSSRLGYF